MARRSLRRLMEQCKETLWSPVYGLDFSEIPTGHQENSGGPIVAMNVILDLCIVPVGAGVSLSSYVAACEKVLTEAGLKTVLHANGTNIEGEWDKVFAAVRRCHEVVHAMGSPRIFTVMKLGTRTDRAQTMDEKTRSVEARLASLQAP